MKHFTHELDAFGKIRFSALLKFLLWAKTQTNVEDSVSF
jgi:hypothetical protein